MKRMQQMKPVNLVRAVIATGACAAIMLAVGCGSGADETAPRDVPADDVDNALNEIEIPTQEELDAEAAEQITPENADEVFQELEDAIMGDLDDDDL